MSFFTAVEAFHTLSTILTGTLVFSVTLFSALEASKNPAAFVCSIRALVLSVTGLSTPEACPVSSDVFVRFRTVGFFVALFPAFEAGPIRMLDWLVLFTVRRIIFLRALELLMPLLAANEASAFHFLTILRALELLMSLLAAEKARVITLVLRACILHVPFLATLKTGFIGTCEPVIFGLLLTRAFPFLVA